eukprot:scaffold443_cov125-Cylindrotheca_fusiformis.AAC.48
MLHGDLNLVDYETNRAREIQERLKAIPNLMLLDGQVDVPKVPVFSFLIKCGTKFLHYNFVCALLNDVFGIQSRGGCQCAGPYAQTMLGMQKHNQEVEHWLVHAKDESLRPGVTRVSLPAIGTTPDQQEYVLKAIEWVAKNGWKFMHVYRCNLRTGEWRHKSRPGAPLGKKERRWLSHFDPLNCEKHDGRPQTQVSVTQAMENANMMLQLVLGDQSSISQSLKMTEGSDDTELRWFVYPKEVVGYIQQGLEQVPGTFDRDQLVGALRPVAWFPQPDVTTVMSEEKKIDLNYRFKDGEHTGEAPLEDIKEGFEDGELSPYCQVFNPVSDSWELLPTFLKEQGQSDSIAASKSTPTGEAVTAPNDSSIHSSHGGTVDNKSSFGEVKTTEEFLSVMTPKEHKGNADEQANIIPLLQTAPIIEKREKKKPLRDSTSWGQGVKVPLNPGISSSEERVTTRRGKSKHVKPPAKLMRLVTQAMIQWDMLQDGDRLLLGLSGGKDSLSLLHVLLEFQKKLPIRFEIEVCTIDPMTPSFDPSSLIPYVEALGLKYHYIRDEIVERAMSAGKDGTVVKSLCAFCARMKRGNLYSCARENNCNKLVLAQHLDDLAESFMMSVMHNGFLRTMKANYKINAGDLSVIRPLVYARESLMTDFAKSANLPIINENCPACFEEPKERARVKKMLSREEALYPSFFDNIKRSMMPLMHDDATAILRSYTEEAIAKSRKVPSGRTAKDGVNLGPNCDSLKDYHHNVTESSSCLSQGALQQLSEDDLVRELARRRAERFRLAGAMPGKGNDPTDPTGQVCTLNGDNGSIPCRELME